MPTLDELQEMFDAEKVDAAETPDDDWEAGELAPLKRKRFPWQRTKAHSPAPEAICAFCDSPLTEQKNTKGEDAGFICSLCRATAPKSTAHALALRTSFSDGPASRVLEREIEAHPVSVVRNAEWVKSLTLDCAACASRRLVALFVKGERRGAWVCLSCCWRMA